MQIIKPYANLYMLHGSMLMSRAIGVQCLRDIETYGRVSHRSEDKQTDESWDKFIKAVVLQHGDWSIVEHINATVEFLVDRGITHELVRHRLFSYTQESTRFVNYTKQGHPPQFICPFDDLDSNDYIDWKNAILEAEGFYSDMVVHGRTPQLARSILPSALASKIIMTGNLRSWRWFFIMRTSKEAHPQMRQVTLPLLQQFKDCIPMLYDDIQPESRQADNLKLPK